MAHREDCQYSGKFHFGPCYTVGTSCCGKPVGCSVSTAPCLHLNHRWKREHLPSLADFAEIERLRGEREDKT